MRYKMMSKIDMRAKGIKSPDIIDAMSFAFLEDVYFNVSCVAFEETEQNYSRLDYLEVAKALFVDVE